MEEEVLVITFIDAENTKRVLNKYFDVAPGRIIAFHNNYFNTLVSLRLVSNPEAPEAPEADATLRDDRGKVDLASFPAIVLLSSSESGTISRCQKVWGSIHGTVCKDAVRILFLDGDNLDEKQTYEIVAWGLRMQIEVVNSLLCEEDGVGIPVRLKRILECSPWASISPDESRQKTAVRESTRDDVMRCETRKASQDNFNLSKPTSLRRGLHESDLTGLLNDLVLADDSDSDSDG